MNKPHIILLNESAFEVASTLASITGGTIEVAKKRSVLATNTYDDAGHHLRGLFEDGQPIIAVMAAGAVIRLLAKSLGDKKTEPPVIAVSQDGLQIVPLLGGHHGAHEMARKMAREILREALQDEAKQVLEEGKKVA
jgi:cobalt-precorrin 5A hydrolase/precorrin-3B C17-methyltransferase